MNAQLSAISSGNWGADWNQIHSEREDLCEKLVYNTIKDHPRIIMPEEMDHLQVTEKLQSRLRLLDDALDRLVAGSYGHCSNCGQPIGLERLHVDPTIARCDRCV